MKNPILLAFVLLAIVTTSRAETAESAHLAFVEISNKTTVADDFGYESLANIEFKALSEKGARENASFKIPFNRVLATVEVLSAETIKTDGKRVPVDASGMVRQVGSLGRFTLSDIEILQVAFPNFAQGDSARVQFRLKSKPLFPGFAYFDARVTERLVHDKVVIELTSPESILWQTDVAGYAEESPQTLDGRRVYRWNYSHPTPRQYEEKQVDISGRQPHLFISSFPTWEALGKAYLDPHAVQAEPSEQIVRLAKELTTDVTDTRQSVKRLYEWVRDNIQYVAIYAGVEGWVPHKASEIFAKRYGDCKDHALLLEVMLRAVGIESVPVLVMANEEDYRLPGVPIPLFNHVISYVPALDLYLDSTAVHADFGQLPDVVQGKPVLRAGLTDALATTPLTTVNDRRIVRRTTIRINRSGGALLETTVRVGGDFRQWLARFRESVAGQENAWAQRMLDRHRRRGSATMAFLADEDGMPGVKIQQTIEQYLPPGEVGLLAFRHVENGPASIQNISDLFQAKNRDSPFHCRAIEIDDVISISLPAPFKVLRVPSDSKASEEGISFRVAYQRSDTEYSMTRGFTWEPGTSAHCTAERWRTWVKPMRRIAASLKSASIVFER